MKIRPITSGIGDGDPRGENPSTYTILLDYSNVPNKCTVLNKRTDATKMDE